METPYYSRHLTLPELRSTTRAEKRNSDYLFIDVPSYPRPELRVSHISHCTTTEALTGIKADSGFRDPGYRPEEPRVVWFSLTVTRAELREAEERPMTIVHPRAREEGFDPNDSEEHLHPGNRELHQTLQEDSGHRDDEREQDTHVLQTFATSPAFESSSRLGSFRFTLALQDVLNKYSQQFCEGQKPVMRVWKTVLFKKEVMYAVLVHSPAEQDMFSEFPLLVDEEDSICAFREHPRPHFIWRPQAMCATHSFGLLVNREDNTLAVVPKPSHDEFNRRVRLSYYVWDHVTLAFHVEDKVLKFGDTELRESLRYCERATPPIRPPPHIRAPPTFQSFEGAQWKVQKLWPLEPLSLEPFSQSQFAIIS